MTKKILKSAVAVILDLLLLGLAVFGITQSSVSQDMQALLGLLFGMICAMPLGSYLVIVWLYE